MKYKSIPLHLLTWCLFLGGCIKDSDIPDKIADIDFSSGVALVNSTLSLSDIVPQNESSFKLEVNSGSDNYYKMVFEPEIFDLPTAGELIILPSQDINGLPPVPISTAVPDLSVNIDVPVTFSGGSTDNDYLKDAQLKSIYLKSGSLDITMLSTIANTVNVTITVINLINRSSGKSIVLNYRLFQGQSTSSPTSFTNAVISLNGQNFLKLKIDYNIEFPASPNTGTLSLNPVSLSNLQWSRIEGRLGEINLPVKLNGNDVENTIIIAPFQNNNSDSTSFSFTDATFNMKISNSYGIPMQIKLFPFKGINKDNTVTKSVDVAPFTLNKPADPGLDQPAISDTTNTAIPSDAISTVLGIAPSQIVFGTSVIVNDTQTSSDDFILSDSKIGIKSTIEVPLYGYINKFKLVSDIDYPLGNNNIDNSTSSPSADLQSVTLKVAYQNAMPLKVDLQIYFLRGDGSMIDSLFESRFIIDGGKVDANGKVNAAASSATPILAVISKSRFDIIDNEAKKIRFSAKVNSTDAPNTKVKLYPDNKLSIQMSGWVKGVVTF